MHINEYSGQITKFLTVLMGILSIFFWLLLIYGFDEPCAAGLTVICALIHETGHAVAFCAVGGWAGIKGYATGPRMGKYLFSSYNEDFLILASGPLANLGAAGVTLLFPDFGGEYGRMFAVLNLVTALSNLLPVKGRDGYGMIECVLYSRELPRGLTWLRIGSVGVTFCTCVLSLYLLDRCGEGFWAYGIFYFSLVSEIFGEVEK